MALDIAWLLQVMFPINLNQPKTLQKKITIITQVLRAIRMGSRIGRLVRITRFFRTERVYLPIVKMNTMSVMDESMITARTLRHESNVPQRQSSNQSSSQARTVNLSRFNSLVAPSIHSFNHTAGALIPTSS